MHRGIMINWVIHSIITLDQEMKAKTHDQDAAYNWK